MDKSQRLRALWRIPLAASAAFALFWGVWWIVAGSVPTTVSSLRMTPYWTVQLPLAVSRWWDVPAAAALAFLITFAFTSRKAREDRALENNELRDGLIIGIVFGLFAGPFAGLAASPIFGLGFGLVVGLVAGLGCSLATGFFCGLGYSLVASLVYGLVACLAYSLVWLIKRVCSISFWQAIGRRLSGR